MDSTKVAVYLRISTEKQTTDSQVFEVNQWLEANDIVLTEDQWYVDTMSGAKFNRPDLNRLRDDCFSGAIKTIVIWRVDRLGRNMMEGLGVLVDWCERDIRIVSITEKVDFSGIIGRMVAALLLGLAEMELKVRKERIRAGIAAAKARGKSWGGNWRLKSKKLEDPRHDKVTQDQIELVIGCYFGQDRAGNKSGMRITNVSRLARLIGVHRATVHKILKMYGPGNKKGKENEEAD